MTKPKKTAQPNTAVAGGIEKLPIQGTPKRSHHKRKDIASGAPEPTQNAQKDGLPAEAFAIVPDPADPAGWQLPHHTGNVLKDVEGSVEWPLIEKSTLLLSLHGNEGCRVSADPAHIIDAARHIAGHYHSAGKPIPIDLCVLI